MIKITRGELAKKIDQTKLNEEATEEEMTRFLEEAKVYKFHSVAVLPSQVKLASRILKGSGVKIVAVLAFPFGSTAPELKELETKYMVKAGADELDMTINNCALHSGQYDVVNKDIEGVVRAADGRTVKIIVEVSYLNQKLLEKACNIAMEAGANFIKTSTGFKRFSGWRSTTVEDITQIKRIVGDQMKVKAAGGIRTTEQALAMLVAGADRLGVSAGVAIVDGLKKLL